MGLPARFGTTNAGEGSAAPASRLTQSQLGRLRRIVGAAVRLAEKGGFEAVRLRDVADASEVALGTLYKYFHGKEDILLFALTDEVEKLEETLAVRPPKGDTALARVTDFFKQATRGLVRKPHFARAVLRSLACGDSETTAKVASFHLRMTRLIVAALQGERPGSVAKVRGAAEAEHERRIAFVLQNVWFASLVGWAGGLHSARAVPEQVRTAAALMVKTRIDKD